MRGGAAIEMSTRIANNVPALMENKEANANRILQKLEALCFASF